DHYRRGRRRVGTWDLGFGIWAGIWNDGQPSNRDRRQPLLRSARPILVGYVDGTSGCGRRHHAECIVARGGGREEDPDAGIVLFNSRRSEIVDEREQEIRGSGPNVDRRPALIQTCPSRDRRGSARPAPARRARAVRIAPSAAPWPAGPAGGAVPCSACAAS